MEIVADCWVYENESCHKKCHKNFEETPQKFDLTVIVRTTRTLPDSEYDGQCSGRKQWQ